MLKGNSDFVLIDEQKVVYEQALALARQLREGRHTVLLVQGGPGTGKSVVAVNLLARHAGDGPELPLREQERGPAGGVPGQAHRFNAPQRIRQPLLRFGLFCGLPGGLLRRADRG